MKGSPASSITSAKVRAEGSEGPEDPLADFVVDGEEPIDPSKVFRHYAPTVGRWAHRLGGPSIDVDDVVQEVFVRVYEHLSGFRGESKLSTWLFQITLNEVRQRKRRERWLGWLKPGESAVEEEPHDEAEAPELSPLARLEQIQDVRRLYQALDGLKEKYRVPLVMFEIDGMTGDDIAELMNVNVSTVWVWLHRGRTQLLERLRALEEKRKF